MRAKILSLICILLAFSRLVVSDEPQQEITPPTGPYVKNGVNIYTTLEFLYWKAIQDGLCYADSGVAVVPGTTVSSGKVHRPDFPWRPGFRVGLGYYPPLDGWDLYANYTFLRSSSTDRAKNSVGNMIPVGLLFPGLTTVNVNQVTAARNHWDLHFNSVDLELGRSFYLSRFLSFRLFSGLKFTWQDQEVNNKYTANRITLGNTTLPGIARSKHDQDLWGVGIRLGGNGNWYFFRSLSLATKVAVSGVWLDYDNTRKDQYEHFGNPALVVNKFTSNMDTIKAVMELFLGLHGEWWLKDDRYHLALQGGFDEQLWFHLGQFLFFPSRSHGDFSMFGLTIKARFDF
ncbi:Lpg1974 family pore-forming outer membrane protein [Simkania sp.]|uniref:Lpg1974 family pore-forming outer membrane protein n=1 Tax=Simkania sp. TaxID=34094 RepID=UPI003B525784